MLFYTHAAVEPCRSTHGYCRTVPFYTTPAKQQPIYKKGSKGKQRCGSAIISIPATLALVVGKQAKPYGGLEADTSEHIPRPHPRAWQNFLSLSCKGVCANCTISRSNSCAREAEAATALSRGCNRVKVRAISSRTAGMHLRWGRGEGEGGMGGGEENVCLPLGLGFRQPIWGSTSTPEC